MATQTDTDTAEQTKDELLEVASDLGIEGRSKMTKDELVEAIEYAKSPPGKKEKAKDEPKFDRDRILADSLALTGHPPYVLAGALADVGGDGPITVSRAKAAADAFLTRAVREDD